MLGAELLAHRLEQLETLIVGFRMKRDVDVTRQVLEQVPERGRLSGPDLTRQLHDPPRSATPYQEVREPVAVAVAQFVEEALVRGARERRFGQAEYVRYNGAPVSTVRIAAKVAEDESRVKSDARAGRAARGARRARRPYCIRLMVSLRMFESRPRRRAPGSTRAWRVPRAEQERGRSRVRQPRRSGEGRGLARPVLRGRRAAPGVVQRHGAARGRPGAAVDRERVQRRARHVQDDGAAASRRTAALRVWKYTRWCRRPVLSSKRRARRYGSHEAPTDVADSLARDSVRCSRWCCSGHVPGRRRTQAVVDGEQRGVRHRLLRLSVMVSLTAGTRRGPRRAPEGRPARSRSRP